MNERTTVQPRGTRLELIWPGKNQFLLVPRDDTGKPVWVERDHPAASEVRLADFSGTAGEVNDANPHADNLLCTGDSLDVLRILAEVPEYAYEYRGKVKLIYIDPPFNTGQTFAHYDDWMEHSTWLSFMRDRLLLMKELLASDGSIWVHLDDAESHRMRLLMDEVFGAHNFVANVIWEKTDAARMTANYMSQRHDNILVYRVSQDFKMNRFVIDNDEIGPYRHVDAEGRRFYTTPLRARGNNNARREDRPNLYFSITDPDGNEVYPTLPNGEDGRWLWSRERVERDINQIVWTRRTGGWNPNVKVYKSEGRTKPAETLWAHDEVGSTRTSARETSTLLGQPFSTPKPERLMERVILLASQAGDIVVDCFGGSGTTAAAAHKLGRRWVTSEIVSSTVETFTRPRLEKVVAGEQGGISKTVNWEGGGGFRAVSVAPSMYEVTSLGVLLAEWATNGKFSRAVAGQLGFDWDPNASPFCGVRGRVRLAVFDGVIGPEEVRHVVGSLGDKERVTIVAQAVLPGAEEELAALSKGSRIRKAPRDLLSAGAARSRRRLEAAERSVEVAEEGESA